MIITIGRKPLECASVCENVKLHNTGGLNIGSCRIGSDSIKINTWDSGAKHFGGSKEDKYSSKQVEGRFPSNVFLSETSVKVIDKQSLDGGMHSAGVAGSKSKVSPSETLFKGFGGNGERYGDSGGASRFFKEIQE